MIVKRFDEVEKNRVEKEGARDVSIRRLIGEDSGAPNFYLRLFEVEPGGHTPLHSHPWEHQVYILEGRGNIETGERTIGIEKDYFALVLPGEKHRFRNTGTAALKFLCVIPKEGS